MIVNPTLLNHEPKLFMNFSLLRVIKEKYEKQRMISVGPAESAKLAEFKWVAFNGKHNLESGTIICKINYNLLVPDPVF